MARIGYCLVAMALTVAVAALADARQVAYAGGDQAVAAAAATAQRVKVLRRALNANREWSGGHSPVPRRAITMNTIHSVAALLTPVDAPALVELMLDDAYDIRTAAARLLAGLTPEAENLTQRRIDLTGDGEQRRRLEAALRDIMAIRATR